MENPLTSLLNEGFSLKLIHDWRTCHCHGQYQRLLGLVNVNTVCELENGHVWLIYTFKMVISPWFSVGLPEGTHHVSRPLARLAAPVFGFAAVSGLGRSRPASKALGWEAGAQLIQ